MTGFAGNLARGTATRSGKDRALGAASRRAESRERTSAARLGTAGHGLFGSTGARIRASRLGARGGLRKVFSAGWMERLPPSLSTPFIKPAWYICWVGAGRWGWCWAQNGTVSLAGASASPTKLGLVGSLTIKARSARAVCL